MTDNRSTCWSLTINNPTAEDEENINLARQKGWKVLGQKEQGEEGTEHYQLMVQTPQVRFSAVKKQFPRAHIEVSRNNAALAHYVTKETTRVGELPVQQSLYPSLSTYWELVVRELDARYYINLDYIYNSRDDRPSSIWWKHAPDSYRRSPLDALDDATVTLIEMGFRVESLAVNPQVRASWRRFHAAIIARSMEDIDRQTRAKRAQEQVSHVDIPTDGHAQFLRTPSGTQEEDNRTPQAEGGEGTSARGAEDCADGEAHRSSTGGN